MKKFNFLFISLFVSANIYAQSYIITFSASGTSTTLDSIRVDNLTQNTAVTCYTDDILELQLSTGIKEIFVDEETIQVLPNPLQEQSEIIFNAKQTGNVKICIYDISGKTLITTEDKVLKGIQKIQLTGLKKGIYFISILGNGYSYTTKLISQNNTLSETKIKYLRNENIEAGVYKPKHTKATVTMTYTEGDSLKFTGYADNLTAIVNKVCTANDTIIFIFNSTVCGEEFIDSRDNNIYPTVLIGNQCWFAKNLMYLPEVAGPGTGSATLPYYYTYGYDGTNVHDAKATANYTVYGVLYNWTAAMNGAASSTSIPSGVQGVCPVGWHLPSDAEWTELITFLGGEGVAGIKLKEQGTSHWNSPNEATNETGFSALPGGLRYTNGAFVNIEIYGHWWSTTENNTDIVIGRAMYHASNAAVTYFENKGSGYSVRCLRN